MKKFVGFQHGINLGGWLSQCPHTEERYSTFIVEDDIKTISSWGLDHLRVPVDYMLVETEDGQYKESGFAYIDKIISWSRKYGLNMILDLHKTYGYSFDKEDNDFFDNENHHERFYRLWKEFARRYSKFDDTVAFELLNEVSSPAYSETWNKISYTCIERIRKIAPKVKILVGGYYNNSISALPDLNMPYDENIVYNFHFYEPLIFTHQGAFWISGMDKNYRVSITEPTKVLNEGSKKYLGHDFVGFKSIDPEKPLDITYFEKMISGAVKISEERNVPIYCGEYGVIDLVDPKEALRWFEMFASVFNKYGIGRAAWSYKRMDFGLTDDRMKEVFPAILKLL